MVPWLNDHCIEEKIDSKGGHPPPPKQANMVNMVLLRSQSLGHTEDFKAFLKDFKAF